MPHQNYDGEQPGKRLKKLGKEDKEINTEKLTTSHEFPGK